MIARLARPFSSFRSVLEIMRRSCVVGTNDDDSLGRLTVICGDNFPFSQFTAACSVRRTMRQINLTDVSHEFGNADLKAVGNLLEI